MTGEIAEARLQHHEREQRRQGEGSGTAGQTVDIGSGDCVRFRSPVEQQAGLERGDGYHQEADTEHDIAGDAEADVAVDPALKPKAVRAGDQGHGRHQGLHRGMDAQVLPRGDTDQSDHDQPDSQGAMHGSRDFEVQGQIVAIEKRADIGQPNQDNEGDDRRNNIGAELAPAAWSLTQTGQEDTASDQSDGGGKVEGCIGSDRPK